MKDAYMQSATPYEGQNDVGDLRHDAIPKQRTCVCGMHVKDTGRRLCFSWLHASTIGTIAKLSDPCWP